MPMFLYDVTLNGVSMSSLADEIVIRDIVELAPEIDRQTAKRALHAGTRVTSTVRRSLSVKVVYVVRAYEGVRRAEILDQIAAWCAGGGLMTINTRPGKRLFVQPADTPRLDSSLKWADDLSLTLTAYEQPYWEDEEAVSVSVSSQWVEAQGQHFFAGVIRPAGNVPRVPLTLMLYNTSKTDPLTHIKIVSEDTFMEFEGLNLAPGTLFGGSISVSYTQNDVQQITNIMAQSPEEISLLKYRTAESSDDLLVSSGKDNQLYVYADQPFWGKIDARGRWL